jgi:hypothetical protein
MKLGIKMFNHKFDIVINALFRSLIANIKHIDECMDMDGKKRTVLQLSLQVCELYYILLPFRSILEKRHITFEDNDCDEKVAHEMIERTFALAKALVEGFSDSFKENNNDAMEKAIINYKAVSAELEDALSVKN